MSEKVLNQTTGKKVTVGGKTYDKLIAQGYVLKDKILVPPKEKTSGQKRSADKKEAKKEAEREQKALENKRHRDLIVQARANYIAREGERQRDSEADAKKQADEARIRAQRVELALAVQRPLPGIRPITTTTTTTTQRPPSPDQHSPAIPREKRIVSTASPKRKDYMQEEGIRISVVPKRLAGRGEQPVVPKKDKLEITAKELLRIIDGPDSDKFFNDVLKSLSGLYDRKIGTYAEKQKGLDRQIADMKRKLGDIENIMGFMDAHSKKEAFPMMQPMILNSVFLKQIVEKIKSSKANLSTTRLKDNFINAITHPTKGIYSLRGKSRASIRNLLATQLYSLRRGYESFFDSFLNMIIMGPAGVGKTTVANVISYVYNKSGILATNNVVTVTRANLIGQYIGHTAPLVNKTLFNTLEGVLFIDEAYQLADCPETLAGGGRPDPFSAEAITEMVNFADKYVGLSVIIAAGYEDKMIRCYLAANEGMPRRFPFKIRLSSYTSSDLTDIFMSFVSRRFGRNIFPDEIRDYIYSLIDKLYTDNPDFFSNQAGDILNFASFFIRRTQSSYNVSWSETGDEEDNKKIINAAMEDYADSKGFNITINE